MVGQRFWAMALEAEREASEVGSFLSGCPTASHVSGPLSVHRQHWLTWLSAPFPSRECWLSMHVGSVSKLSQLGTCLHHSDCPLLVPAFLGRTGGSGMAENVWQIPLAQSQGTCTVWGQRGQEVKCSGHKGVGTKVRCNAEGAIKPLLRWLPHIISPARKSTSSETPVCTRYC